MAALWTAFLALLGVQILNAGSVIQTASGLDVTFAPVAWLPFTLFRGRAVVDLVIWAAVAALCVAAVRPAWRDRIARFERPVLIVAVALALLGIAQYHTGATAYFWTFPVAKKYSPEFFSLFAYINNAGTFFMLAAGLALARGWRNLPLVALFAYCTWLTHTRAAWPMIAILVAVKAIGEMPAQYRRGMYGVLACAAVAWFAVVVDVIMEFRWIEYAINLRIIADKPLFGYGAYGNHIAPWFYTPAWAHDIIGSQPNTHCDPLVFTVEYGLAGAGLLAAIAFAMLRPLGTRLLTGCRGLAVTLGLCHSMIDMPLRCPAVLIMMAFMLIGGRRDGITATAI